MKHKVTAVLTAFLMCTGSLPVFAQGESVNTMGTYFGLKWDITDGVLTISGNGEIVYDHGFPDGDSANYPNWGYRDRIKTIVLEEGVTYADAETFSNYPALETVVLPEQFDTLSARLFENCPNLREIQGIEHVEYFSMNCLSGTAMTAESPFVITNGELQYCDISEPMEIVVPDGVTSIGRDAFGNLMNVTSDTLLTDPFHTKTLEDLYFSITLPETVEKIDAYAFANLPMLISVNLPESVTEIGEFAFFNCVRLDALTLGENVQSVGDFAFLNCREMDTLTVLSNDAQFGKWAFGTILDSVRYWKDSVPDYTEEQIADDLDFDPYYYDQILYNRLDWFGSMNYLYVSGKELDTDRMGVYSVVPETTIVRGYLNSTSHAFAQDMGLPFSSIDKGNITLGDINGDTMVNAIDAAAILTASAAAGVGDKSKLNAEQKFCADLNGDRRFNATDAAIILQYAAYTGTGGMGTIEEFLKERA